MSLIPLKYRASIERKNNFHPFGAHFIIKHRRQRLKAAPHHWLCTRTRSCAFKNHLNEILTDDDDDDGKLFVPPFNCGPSRSFAPLEGWHPLPILVGHRRYNFLHNLKPPNVARVYRRTYHSHSLLPLSYPLSAALTLLPAMLYMKKTN